MSSTSSTECIRDQLQYGRAWENAIESPWYPTFKHPLIYYSQVQPVNIRQRSKEHENNKSNCFKKAFRWYTQDHTIIKNGRMASSDNINNTSCKGFAAWLDEKYNEYLQTSRNDRHQYILNQTSSAEINRIGNYDQFKVAKKHKKIKSPWKKRRKYLDTKENGDVIMKSNESITIIFKPKDLSRPASECCERTKAQTCCNRSNNTVDSNASTLQKVTQPKSQSLNSVIMEKEIYMIPSDAPVYGAKKEMVRENEKTPNRNTSKREEFLWKTKKQRLNDVSCQCSKDMSRNADASSQFEKKETKYSNICACNEKNMKLITSIHNHTIETKPLITPKSPACFEEEEIQSPVSIIRSKEKHGIPFLTFVNHDVQTSDRSINLRDISKMFESERIDYIMAPQITETTQIENGSTTNRPTTDQSVCEYPLFVKIICADKLRDN